MVKCVSNLFVNLYTSRIEFEGIIVTKKFLVKHFGSAFLKGYNEVRKKLKKKGMI